MFRPVKSSKLSDQVFEQVRDSILNGDYKPDQMLPSERELCDSFGVNRSSVREALKRLEQVGLIEIRQGSGCLVLDFHTSAGFSVLQDMIVPEGELNIRAAEGILEFRAVFFPAFAKRAAGRMNQAALRSLEEIVARIEACTEQEYDEFQRLDLAFHGVVARASDNLAFMLLFNSYRNIYYKVYNKITEVFMQMMEHRHRYRLIYDAFCSGNAQSCESLYTDLIAQGNASFMQHYVQADGAARKPLSATGQAVE